MNSMMRKTAAALGVASLIVVGAASAQDAATTPETSADTTAEQAYGYREGFMHDLVLEYTGLDEAALHQAMLDGSTLSELIEANGRTVADFIAAVLTEYDAQAVDRRAQFEANLSAALESGAPMFGGHMFGMPGMRDGMGDFGMRGGMGDFGMRGMDGFRGRGGRGGHFGGPGFFGTTPPVTEDAPSTDTSTTGI